MDVIYLLRWFNWRFQSKVNEYIYTLFYKIQYVSIFVVLLTVQQQRKLVSHAPIHKAVFAKLIAAHAQPGTRQLDVNQEHINCPVLHYTLQSDIDWISIMGQLFNLNGHPKISVRPETDQETDLVENLQTGAFLVYYHQSRTEICPFVLPSLCKNQFGKELTKIILIIRLPRRSI